ncbi:MAG: hypothetical protein FWF84_01380 [Kiritimatiellaeota bacterium]|nr:hypothetical protein [Kiritimatiellota bacterium]
MKRIMAMMVGAGVGWVASGGYALAVTGELATFTLTEYLGTAWSNECVTFAIDEAMAAKLWGGKVPSASRRDGSLGSGAVCRGDDGVEVPWQLTADGKGVRFIAALPEYGKRVYAFDKGKPSVKTSLAVKETKEYFEITNALTGVRISKILTGANGATGPIVAWRLSDGTWAGGSTFTPTRKIASYKVTVVEKGAVLVKVEAVATFAGGGSWKIAAELIDGEPSFKIRETFDGSQGSDKKSIEHRSEDLCHLGTFSLRFDKGLDPDWILFRSGHEFPLRGGHISLGRTLTWPLSYAPDKEAANRFYLQPWVWWAVSPVRGRFFTLMNLEKDAAVTMTTSDTKAWVDPSIPAEERATPAAWLKYGDDGKMLTMEWEVKKGEREYVLSVVAVTPIMEDFWGVPAAEIPPPDMESGPPNLLPAWDGNWGHFNRYHRPPLSEALALRLAHYPLDRVKDLVLEWPETDMGSIRPRMMVSQEEIAAFRARMAEVADADKGWVNYGVHNVITSYSVEAIFPGYLATQDPIVGARLYTDVPKLVKDYVDEFRTLGGGHFSLGVAAHARGPLIAVAQFVDLWFSLPQVTAEDRMRLKGQMAFLAYLVGSEEYFSPERGFAGGLLGMRTLVAMKQLALGAALVDHPLTRQWMDMGASYLYENTVDLWEVDGEFNGTAIQCPHYALGDFCSAMAMFLMQEQQGIPNPINTPRVKDHGAWYAKISTPRDPRFGYWRHLPPVGNSMLYEPTGICGNLASIYRERDPEFSAAMQWMDNEQNNPLLPGVGGFDPSLSGVRRIFYDKTLPAKVPDWTSEHFRDNGVVFRSRLATEDENFLYLIAGEGSTPINHWDREQGNISQLWLRSIPVADDFGYVGCMPEADASMLDSGKSGGILVIEDFKVTPKVDYVRGRKVTSSYDFLSPRGVGIETVVEERPVPWVREIALVKHEGKAPDYFVIKDTLSEAIDATWRMWLTPKVASDELEGDVFITDMGAWMESYDNRTTHIYFPVKPADATVSVEPKTQGTVGMNDKFVYIGARTNTRMGLILHSPTFDAAIAVVYTRREGEAEPVVALADDGAITVEHAGIRDTIRFTADGVEVE